MSMYGKSHYSIVKQLASNLKKKKKKKTQITEYSDLDPSQYVSEPKAIFSSFSLTRSLTLLLEVRKCSKDLHRSLFI